MRGLSSAAAGFVIGLTFAAASARAECTYVAAAGNGPTKDIATLMSTHGLDNIIESRGLKGQGPVKTTCEAGTFLTECRSTQKACK